MTGGSNVQMIGSDGERNGNLEGLTLSLNHTGFIWREQDQVRSAGGHSDERQPKKWSNEELEGPTQLVKLIIRYILHVPTKQFKD